MHQTTVRFTAELWAQLEEEAQRSGVSAAQYVRDSTLARLAYTAGQRGDDPFGARLAAERPVRSLHDNIEESSAAWEQARLARARARTVREGARAAQALVAARHTRERPPRSGG